MTDSQAFKKISLDETQNSDLGYISKKYSDDLIGKKGKTFTVLRPSGKILINDEIYDATSSGEFIEKNTKVEIISNEGSNLKVKKS